MLLLEGTSFDQYGRPMEVFSTWQHLDHVLLDIDTQREPAVSSVPAGPVSFPAVDNPESVADKARQLGADLPRFADRISDASR